MHQWNAIWRLSIYFLLWSCYILYEITSPSDTYRIIVTFEDNFSLNDSVKQIYIHDQGFVLYPWPRTLTHESLIILHWNEIIQLSIMNLIWIKIQPPPILLNGLVTIWSQFNYIYKKCSLHIKDNLMKIMFFSGIHQFLYTYSNMNL